MLKTIEWKDNRVIMIDQRMLPAEEVYKECLDFMDVAEAIREMVIRGAPAIGVAAAFGAVLGAIHIEDRDREGFIRAFDNICDTLANTRPTAKNLFWAIERMKGNLDKNPDASPEELKKILKNDALKIYEEDIETNKRIGIEGGALIKDGDNILTHCNAGALATAGYGTALGVIRNAFEQGKNIHIFADETRPFLQGARLTAWELMKDGIPVTVITDNMAGYLMKKGLIDVVVVGADRIAANGDVANKIGTYSVAVLAKENGIPFYVAAPFSTIDMDLKDGDKIPIEERDPSEVTHIKGIQLTPQGTNIKNPAFDITPNKLVQGIITEKGIITSPYVENLKARSV